MTVSLIISTFNRGHLLETTLKRLSKLTQPNEVIIIDDGSSDETATIARRANDYLQCPVHYIYRHWPEWDSCAIPKNIGLKVAKGEILIFSEPEVLYVSDIVAQTREFFQNNKDLVVTAGDMYFARVHSPTPNNDLLVADPLSHIKEVAGTDEYKPGHPDQYANGPTFAHTQGMVAPYMMGVLRKHALDIGGWDEMQSRINGGGGWGFDDTDFLTRLRENKINQTINLEFTCVHLWHERPPLPVQDEGWRLNEKIMLSKEFPRDIVANKDKEWGLL